MDVEHMFPALERGLDPPIADLQTIDFDPPAGIAEVFRRSRPRIVDDQTVGLNLNEADHPKRSRRACTHWTSPQPTDGANCRRRWFSCPTGVGSPSLM